MYELEPTHTADDLAIRDDVLPVPESYLLDLHSNLVKERDYRRRNGTSGAIDLWLAAKISLVCTTLGEVVQTERDGYVAEARNLKELFPDTDPSTIMAVDPNSHLPLMEFASIPYDLKAVGVAAGAFAIAGAARRIRRHNRFNRDAESAIRQVASSTDYQPHSEGSRRKFRLMRRLGDATLTAAATLGAYQVAKHGTMEQDMYAALGLNIAALGTVAATHLRNKFKSRQPGQHLELA